MRLGSFRVKLALGRVSAAFKKARSPQQEIMLEPPTETKGRVTPVRGRISTAPSTFRVAWNTSMAAAELAAMT